MTHPADAASQTHIRGSSHSFISHPTFEFGDGIGISDRNLSSYEDAELSCPLDNMSDLECTNEKAVLVRSIRTKDADSDTSNVLSNEVNTYSRGEDFLGKKRVDLEQEKEDDGGNENEDNLNEVRRPLKDTHVA